MTDRLLRSYPPWLTDQSDQNQWSLLLQRQEKYYQSQLSGLQSVLTSTHNALRNVRPSVNPSLVLIVCFLGDRDIASIIQIEQWINLIVQIRIFPPGAAQPVFSLFFFQPPVLFSFHKDLIEERQRAFRIFVQVF